LESIKKKNAFGRGLQAKTVTKILENIKTEGHEFGGKIDYANFR
jgi:hypothetical protein